MNEGCRRKKQIKNEGFRLLIVQGNHGIERAFSGFGLGELSDAIERTFSKPKIMKFGNESFTYLDSYNSVGALGKKTQCSATVGGIKGGLRVII
ncbi:hypothetical protein U1Q18_015158 [Sarracenia purpurea var. burkii]